MQNKLTKLTYILFYIIVHYVFIRFFIEIDSVQKKLASIYELFELSQKELNLIISIGLVIFTLTYLLIQYLIAKFLVLIFVEKLKPKIEYVFIPKVFITILNIIFISIFSIQTSWFYAFTAFFGAIFILMFTQFKSNTWKFSIIFSIPFLFDAITQLIREINKLF